jgi:hypothetical protein
MFNQEKDKERQRGSLIMVPLINSRFSTKCEWCGKKKLIGQ